MLRGPLAFTVVALCLLLVPAGSSAQRTIPAPRRALLLLRVLSYDRNLEARGGNPIRIALLYDSQNGSSEADCKKMKTALEQAAGKYSLGGRSVEVFSMDYSSADTVQRELTNKQVAALYTCSGMTSRIAALTETTQSRSVLTFSGSRRDVQAGVGVGLALVRGKAKMLVNVSAATAEGADLDPALLRVAEVVN